MSRRAVVGAAVIGTAGCSFPSLDPSPEDPTITPTSTPTSSRTGAPEVAETTTGAAVDPEPDDPDAALVESTLLAVSTAHHEARSASRAFPALADALDPLVRLHRAQAGELGGLRPPARRPPDRAASQAKARRRVARSEADLQATLVAAATDADSGALARLLASMAAAVAQHRERL